MHIAMDWDDLRIVLALGEAGSLSAAGHRLKVSHATVFRRLNAIEARLGVRLFDRSRSGYTPTAAGQDLVESASQVDEIVATSERRLMGQDLRPTGTIRVTTTDTLLHALLMPICAAFRRTYPGVVLELAVSNHLFNLTKREADIALRPTSRSSETLVGRKVGRIAHSIYAPVRALPRNKKSEPWRDMNWIAPDAEVPYQHLVKWMADNGVDKRVVYRANSVLSMLDATKAGLGCAVLPCYLADPERKLRCLGHPIPSLETDLWLVTHPDMRHVARVRAFLEFANEAIRAKEGLLRGRAAAAKR
jgi:DNA-binding transcriptional LysR family regulator